MRGAVSPDASASPRISVFAAMNAGYAWVREVVHGRQGWVGQGHARVSCSPRRCSAGSMFRGRWRKPSAVDDGLPSGSEQGHLLAAPLDRRVEPKVWLEVGQVERIAVEEC